MLTSDDGYYGEQDYDQEKLIQLLGLLDWYNSKRSREKEGAGMVVFLRSKDLRADIMERLT